MQCVEFELRLNDLVDERRWPTADAVLLAHAQDCANCSELLAAHEVLLEGLQSLPTVQLSATKQQAFATRVVAEVGSAPAAHFPAGVEVALADVALPVVAKSTAASLALIGVVLATAAAVLIAVLPWFRFDEPGGTPDRGNSVVDQQTPTPLVSPRSKLAKADDELEPIAWVGYQVADGLRPVTNSMVSALRELRKRPLFRNADENGRSSFYLPRDEREMVA